MDPLGQGTGLFAARPRQGSWLQRLRNAELGAGTILARLQAQPQGSKVPKYGVYMVSILGIVVMVLGMYSVFGYLDP